MRIYKILHIITGLKVGGAENALLRLILNSPSNCRHTVVSLTSGGAMHNVFLQSNINVVALDFKKSFFLSFYNLIGQIRLQRPDVVQTWLYHSNILGGIAAKIAGIRAIVWGLRGTAIPQGFFSTSSMIVILGSVASFFIPSVIVCNAESVKEFHKRKGYKRSKLRVIPNGFFFDKNKSKKIGNMHDLNDGVITIGTVGRFDPLKDYSNMIDACSLIMNKYKNVNLMMIGKGLAPSNATLISLLCKKMDLSRIYLLGERDNVNNFLEVIDIFCMSSSNEGFPNALCEAMLMSKPCVVTDAGDMSNIVSETGIIVPIRDHIKLASGLEHMIKIGASGRKSLGKMAAIRIKSNYPIEKNVSMFTDLYLEVIDEK